MSKEFEDLLGQYWDLAHFEGNSGVSQGDKANEVLRALKKLAQQLAPVQQEPKWYHFVRRGEDCFVPYEGQAPADATRLYTTPQPAQPLTPDLEADTGYSRDERAAFTAGWEAAEAAHGITKGNT
jgi:hypothetical protein